MSQALPPPPPSDSKLPSLLAEMKRRFQIYAHSPSLGKFARRSMSQAKWWNPLHQLAVIMGKYSTRQTATRLADSGEPWLGVVLMRNTMLDEPGEVAPALVLATSNTTLAGYRQLQATGERIDELCEAGNDEAMTIYLNEDYVENHRRALPVVVGAPREIQLFNVMVQSEDFVPVEISPGHFFPHPFLALMGTPETGPRPMNLEAVRKYSLDGGQSAIPADEEKLAMVIPGSISLPVLNLLMDCGTEGHGLRLDPDEVGKWEPDPSVTQLKQSAILFNLLTICLVAFFGILIWLIAKDADYRKQYVMGGMTILSALSATLLWRIGRPIWAGLYLLLVFLAPVAGVLAPILVWVSGSRHLKRSGAKVGILGARVGSLRSKT